LSLQPPSPPRATLFPYTTLFRSDVTGEAGAAEASGDGVEERPNKPDRNDPTPCSIPCCSGLFSSPASMLRSSSRIAEWLISRERSEEHTSELQSRSDLVCRLLLE